MSRIVSRFFAGVLALVLTAGSLSLASLPAGAEEPTPTPTPTPAPTVEPSPIPLPPHEVAELATIEASSPAVEMTVITDKPGELYSFKLTALTTGVTETGVTYSHQWYRVNRTTLASTAITGATSQSYRPVAADYKYELKVRVVVKKTNYTPLTLHAEPRDFSVRINPTFPLLLNDTEPWPDYELSHGPRSSRSRTAAAC
jgi:hypothetical protein